MKPQGKTRRNYHLEGFLQDVHGVVPRLLGDEDAERTAVPGHSKSVATRRIFSITPCQHFLRRARIQVQIHQSGRTFTVSPYFALSASLHVHTCKHTRDNIDGQASNREDMKRRSRSKKPPKAQHAQKRKQKHQSFTMRRRPLAPQGPRRCARWRRAVSRHPHPRTVLSSTLCRTSRPRRS